MDLLHKIKDLVFRGQVIFTSKSEDEMMRDRISREMVQQAILNAPVINKTVRSRSPMRSGQETLHVIIGSTYTGIIVYT